jgi:hypothetical protein
VWYLLFPLSTDDGHLKVCQFKDTTEFQVAPKTALQEVMHLASRNIFSSCKISHVLKETVSKDFLLLPESGYGSCPRTV